MSPGRCAGCGKTHQSCKVIRTHTMSCPDYLKLFKESPEKALDPEAEHRRWNEEENSDEARAEAKDVRLQKRFAELDAKRDEQTTRWSTPPSILD